MILIQNEHAVLEGVLTGASNAEIATIINRSEKTVKAHVTHILRKCGYPTRCKLIVGFHASHDFVINSTDDGLFRIVRFGAAELQPTEQIGA